MRWDDDTPIAVEPGRDDGFRSGVNLMAGFRVVGPCGGGVGSGLSRTESGRECDRCGPRMVTLFDKSITSSPFPPAISPISLIFTTCDSPSSSIRSLLTRPSDGATQELLRLNEPRGARRRLPLPLPLGPGELSRRVGRLSEDRERECEWESAMEDVRLREGTASTE